VKSLGKFPDRFIQEIVGQPEAVRRAEAALIRQGDAVSRLRRAIDHPEPVIFTGMGSSYDACYPAVTTLAGRGVDCWMLDTAELLHFRMAALKRAGVLALVSQSGESAELVRLVERLPADRPLVAAITNGPSNTLAEAADIALDTGAGEEHGPSTMTFAAALAVLDALVGDPPFERAALEMERLVAEPEATADRLCEWIDGRPTLALVGRGSARAAAEMGALTLKEAARFPAESLQAAQFRHGPLELAGPRLAVVVIATEQRTRELELGLAGELAAAGAAVLVVSQDGEAPDGCESVAVGPLENGLAAAAATIPVQLLAWRLARSRGLTPGEFAIAGNHPDYPRAVLEVLLVIPIWSISGLAGVLAAYAVEIYPTKIRARGGSLSAGATKLGGVLILALAAAAAATPSIRTTAIVGLLPMVLAIFFLIVFGPETRRRSLEHIAKTQLETAANSDTRR